MTTTWLNTSPKLTNTTAPIDPLYEQVQSPIITVNLTNSTLMPADPVLLKEAALAVNQACLFTNASGLNAPANASAFYARSGINYVSSNGTCVSGDGFCKAGVAFLWTFKNTTVNNTLYAANGCEVPCVCKPLYYYLTRSATSAANPSWNDNSYCSDVLGLRDTASTEYVIRRGSWSYERCAYECVPLARSALLPLLTLTVTNANGGVDPSVPGELPGCMQVDTFASSATYTRPRNESALETQFLSEIKCFSVPLNDTTCSRNSTRSALKATYDTTAQVRHAPRSAGWAGHAEMNLSQPVSMAMQD